MLNTIMNLFGRSPFMPLQLHMDKVACCVHMLPELFQIIQREDQAALQQITEKISELEHQADLAKNDIRNHLPKGLFLAIDRSHLLDILSLQDSIADAAEDVAVLVTLKPIVMPVRFQNDFTVFLDKTIAAFDGVHLIIKEMHELLESSFGGVEALKVRSMVDDVAFKEHEVDLIQRKLLKVLFQSENEMSYSTFDLWQRIFEALGAISNLSENVANKVRMTLELK